MRANNRSFLITLLIACICLTGCGLFSKSEKENVSGERIRIIIQFKKNADIESIIKQYNNLNLVAIKMLSKRMNTWEMSINYNPEETDKALQLLKNNEHITTAQLNHKIEQRNDE